MKSLIKVQQEEAVPHDRAWRICCDLDVTGCPLYDKANLAETMFRENLKRTPL